MFVGGSGPCGAEGLAALVVTIYEVRHTHSLVKQTAETPYRHDIIMLSRIYDCTKHCNQPIGNATTAHFTHISML